MTVSCSIFLAVLLLLLAYAGGMFDIVRWIFDLGRRTARWRRPPPPPPAPLPVDDVILRLLRLGWRVHDPTIPPTPRSWYDARPPRS